MDDIVALLHYFLCFYFFLLFIYWIEEKKRISNFYVLTSNDVHIPWTSYNTYRTWNIVENIEVQCHWSCGSRHIQSIWFYVLDIRVFLSFSIHGITLNSDFPLWKETKAFLCEYWIYIHFFPCSSLNLLIFIHWYQPVHCTQLANYYLFKSNWHEIFEF